MNIHGIEYDSMLNGDGLRAVVWVSGCNHKCKGCQNPQTWPVNSGRRLNLTDISELRRYLKNDYAAGITFSGGDPLHPANRRMVCAMAKYFKQRFPDKTIWLYTGYLYEEVKDLPVFEYVDVVVDGEFVQELADVTYHWAGSTNQTVRYLTKKEG